MDNPSNPLRPVQVILDGDRFLKAPEKPSGASQKDFFAGDDVAFAHHKAQIRQDLDGFAETLERHGDPVGFVHVDLRETAIAKSHRPLDRLFSPAHKFALVGGEADGQLIVQGTPRALKELADYIEDNAELHPRMGVNRITNEPEAKPSETRSELGCKSRSNNPSLKRPVCSVAPE